MGHPGLNPRVRGSSPWRRTDQVRRKVVAQHDAGAQRAEATIEAFRKQIQAAS